MSKEESNQVKNTPVQLVASLACEQGLLSIEQSKQVLATGTHSIESFCQNAVQLGLLTAAQAERLRTDAGERQEKQLVLGGYEIIRLVAVDDYIKIYLARQLSIDRIVILKILPRSSITINAVETAKFVDQARRIAKLNHPNIIHAIDVGQLDDCYYFALEYVDSPTVRELMDKQGQLPLVQVIDIILQTCTALQHMAENNVVHRDISPDTLFWTENKTLRVAGFGLAYPGKQASYVSPEQVENLPLTHLSDQYSLGTVLFELLTGKPAWSGGVAPVVMAKRLQTAAPKASDINPAIPQELSAICRKMMAVSPDKRFSDFRQVETALKNFVTKQDPALIAAPILATPTPPAQKIITDTADSTQSDKFVKQVEDQQKQASITDKQKKSPAVEKTSTPVKTEPDITTVDAVKSVKKTDKTETSAKNPVQAEKSEKAVTKDHTATKTTDKPNLGRNTPKTSASQRGLRAGAINAKSQRHISQRFNQFDQPKPLSTGQKIAIGLLSFWGIVFIIGIFLWVSYGHLLGGPRHPLLTNQYWISVEDNITDEEAPAVKPRAAWVNAQDAHDKFISRTERKLRKEDVIALYNEIITNWPDSAYAAKAKMRCEMLMQ